MYVSSLQSLKSILIFMCMFYGERNKIGAVFGCTTVAHGTAINVIGQAQHAG